MRTTCSRAGRPSAKHADGSHADRLVPGKQQRGSTINLSSSDAPQLDDGQVLTSRAVLDREFEAPCFFFQGKTDLIRFAVPYDVVRGLLQDSIDDDLQRIGHVVFFNRYFLFDANTRMHFSKFPAKP